MWHFGSQESEECLKSLHSLPCMPMVIESPWAGYSLQTVHLNECSPNSMLEFLSPDNTGLCLQIKAQQQLFNLVKQNENFSNILPNPL